MIYALYKLGGYFLEIKFNNTVTKEEFKIMKNSNKEILIGLQTIKNLNILKPDWPMRHSVNIDYSCKNCGRDFNPASRRNVFFNKTINIIIDIV